MSTTPTPDVAAAMERLEKVAYFKVRQGDAMVDAHPDLSLLLTSHARLAEECGRLNELLARANTAMGGYKP